MTTTELGRDPRRPGRQPVLLSLGLHLILVVAAWLTSRGGGEEIEYVTYQMQLITEAELEALESPPLVETPNLAPPEPERPGCRHHRRVVRTGYAEWSRRGQCGLFRIAGRPTYRAGI